MGLWPNAVSKSHKNNLLRITFWLHFTGTVGLLILFETVFVLKFANNGDFIEFVKTFGTIVYHIVCMLTMLLWLNKFSLVKSIYKLINRKSFKRFTLIIVLNDKFVKDCGVKAKFWSLVALFLFLAGASSSLLISYVGICVFPEKNYHEETGRFIRVKPYNSYTFLNLERVSVVGIFL